MASLKLTWSIVQRSSWPRCWPVVTSLKEPEKCKKMPTVILLLLTSASGLIRMSSYQHSISFYGKKIPSKMCLFIWKRFLKWINIIIIKIIILLRADIECLEKDNHRVYLSLRMMCLEKKLTGIVEFWEKAAKFRRIFPSDNKYKMSNNNFLMLFGEYLFVDCHRCFVV